MVPTNVLLDRLATLLSTDASSLAPVALAVHVHLAKAAFTPGPGLTVGSFTEADFTGYAALSAGVGPQQNFTDPATGGRVVQLLEPAGGWHWQATGAALLPQTIYGIYVTDNANAVLYGSMLITPSVIIGVIGNGIDVDQVRFVIQANAIV